MRAKLGDGVMACGNSTKDADLSGWARRIPLTASGVWQSARTRTITRFL